MKKIVIFLGVVIVLFGAISYLTNAKNEEKSADNPYKKETLDPLTIAQLDDPNYQNLILPDELKEKLDKGEDVTVYFYSPACTHCQRTTPELVPLVEEMDINLEKYNLLEFEQGWDDYKIESTPTIVQYKDGKESARIVGYNDPEVFRTWFNENTK
jgi:thiol-disulfide isomerase/thioredoxin